MDMAAEAVLAEDLGVVTEEVVDTVAVSEVVTEADTEEVGAVDLVAMVISEVEDMI